MISATWTPGITFRRCDRKRAYPNEKVAAIVARNATFRARSIILPYQCPDCRQWHIGHPSREEQRRLAPELAEMLAVWDRGPKLKVADRTRRVVVPEVLGQRFSPIVPKPYEPVRVISTPVPEVPKDVDFRGMRHGFMTIGRYLGHKKWEAVCDCGVVEVRNTPKLRTLSEIDCCLVCDRVANWMRYQFLGETGFYLPGEFFREAAVKFSREMSKVERGGEDEIHS